MKNDQLYLLKADFHDQGKIYFCPGCAEVLGLLELYPALKKSIDVHYVDFARPRPELVSLLGEEHQSCPVLVLATSAPGLPAEIEVQHANGRDFVAGPEPIGAYLSSVHQIGVRY